MKPYLLTLLAACLFPVLSAQDTLSFGGVYDLPGAEVRATYAPVSPLAQRFTIEEVYRLPGTFYDPARLVNLLPAVVQTNDQANHLSVRGATPNANLWRLNGLAIVNPNHTANAGTFYDFPTLSGGGVNAISAQMLGNSAFIAGNPTVNYGYASGGTFDLQLRPGDARRRRYQVQAGLIGLDLAAEGPLTASGNVQYLVNARYSFTGLLGDLGVDFGGEEIRFADLNAHLSYAGRRSRLSLFSILGQSANDFTAPDPATEEITEQKELFNITFEDELRVYGGNYRLDFPDGGALTAGAAYSTNEPRRTQQRRAFDSSHRHRLNHRLFSSQLRYDSAPSGNAQPSDNWYLGAELYRDERSLLSFGGGEQTPGRGFFHEGADEITALSPYAGYAVTLGNDDSHRFGFGLRGDFYLGSQLRAVYPVGHVRYAKRWQHRELAVSVSQASQPSAARLLTSYLGGVEDFADLTSQLDLSYATRLLGATVKATAFAQATDKTLAAREGDFLVSANNLYELDPNLRFQTTTATLRYGLELEAAGGRRTEGWYYRGSLTLLEARTEQEDGNYRRDRYSVGFIGKLTLGREWAGRDRRDRDRTLGLNLALIGHGGERYGRVSGPLGDLPPESIINYFQPQDLTDGFVNTLGAYFRPDLRLYKTKVRPRTTTTLALDVQNLAAVRNVGSVYYDSFLDRANERSQLSLIPVLSYRIVWR